MNKIKIALMTAGCIATATMLSHPAAKAETDGDGFIRIKAGEEQYKNPFGVEVATLFGDPSKPGIYVLRIKWPPGIMSKPHKHPEDRHVVVLSGSWYTGTGETFEPEKAIPLKTGAYMMHPNGKVHWDGTREEGAVIQITRDTVRAATSSASRTSRSSARPTETSCKPGKSRPNGAAFF